MKPPGLGQGFEDGHLAVGVEGSRLDHLTGDGDTVGLGEHQDVIGPEFVVLAQVTLVEQSAQVNALGLGLAVAHQEHHPVFGALDDTAADLGEQVQDPSASGPRAASTTRA